MSWDQGVQSRDDLPQSLIDRFEEAYRKHTGEESALEYLTWFGVRPTEIVAHYASNRGFLFKVN